MEKRAEPLTHRNLHIIRTAVFLIIFSRLFFCATAQSPDQPEPAKQIPPDIISDAATGADRLNNIHNPQTVTVPVWVFYEPPPDIPAGQWDPPRQRLQETARYLMEAAVFGWDVSYTPYDRMRNVEEQFESAPVFVLPSDAVTLTAVERKNDKLCAVAAYTMSPDRAQWYNQWKGVQYRTFGGAGDGDSTKELTGFSQAIQNAVKEAVRAYGRSIKKNKPKEICALIRLAGQPRITLKSGAYHAELKVRIYIKEVVPYTVY